MTIDIVIPVFNEAGCVVKNLQRLKKYLLANPSHINYRIIVVDDGSFDGTAEVIRHLNWPELKLVSYSKNQGKGYAVKQGMLSSQADYTFFMDADLATSLEEINKFIEKIQGGYDIVIGSRAITGASIIIHQPFWKEKFGQLGNIIIQLITGLKYKDTQCGFKLFNHRSLEIFKYQLNNRWAFDVELLTIAKVNNLKVLELPVTWQDDGHSKVTLSSYPRFFLEVLKIYINKLKGKYDFIQK